MSSSYNNRRNHNRVQNNNRNNSNNRIPNNGSLDPRGNRNQSAGFFNPPNYSNNVILHDMSVPPPSYIQQPYNNGVYFPHPNFQNIDRPFPNQMPYRQQMTPNYNNGNNQQNLNTIKYDCDDNLKNISNMLKTLETRIEHYTIYNRTHEEKTELQSKDDMCFMAYDVERIAEGCEKDLKETLLQYKESFQKWNCNFKEFKKICKEYLFEEKSIFTVTKWFLKYYTKPKIFHVIIKYITALFFVNSDMSYYDKVLQIVEKLLESILGKVTIFQNIIPEYVLELSYLYCAIERVDKSFLILKWDPTFGKIYNEYLECRDFAKKLQSSNQEELNIHSSNFVKNMIEKGGIKMDMQIERYNPKEETFVPKDKINEFQEILNECKKKYDKCLLKFNEIKEGNVGAPIVLNNVKNNTLDQRIRKRNWFEREFYGHYSSIFKINNVKYEPIDVTNNVDFSQNGIISKEAESCFENLRNIVNGQAVINMEKHEKFEKSLKAIKRLRDQEENIAEEEGRSQYSYNFVNIEEFF